MRRLMMAAMLCVFAGGASAQQVIAEYYAMLSNNDRFNSRGTLLTDFGAILQQDRANFHRFGTGDSNDDWDPVFGSPEMRALIPGLYANGPGAPGYIRNSALNGQGAFVYVRVFGRNGVPSWIEVYQGAG